MKQLKSYCAFYIAASLDFSRLPSSLSVTHLTLHLTLPMRKVFHPSPFHFSYCAAQDAVELLLIALEGELLDFLH